MSSSEFSAIGGYFGLEKSPGAEYHTDLIRLNTGRNAFEYILRAYHCKTVYVPYYTCDVLLEPLNRLGIPFGFYSIDANLDPVLDIKALGPDDYLLYTNYFGIKGHTITRLLSKTGNLIIDNCQAFYARPHSAVPAFYSPRKFFGVPDGGYLYTPKRLAETFSVDTSSGRISHLLKRVEESAEAGYEDFIRNDKSLSQQPIKQMSSLTRNLLGGIDYQAAREKRIGNFLFLHKALKASNKLTIDFDPSADVPMVYPFWSDDPALRGYLVAQKIYTAAYWPNVPQWLPDPQSVEQQLFHHLVALPVDQRYGNTEMQYILDLIEKRKNHG